MNELIYILPFIFAHLSGFFKACQDITSDVRDNRNLLRMYIYSKGYDYEMWYNGGNKVYPPGNPFKCDFWHFAGHCRTFCFSGAVLSAMLSVLINPSYLVLLYGLCYGVIGYSFTFYYSFIFRKDHNWSWYWRHVLYDTWKTQK